METIKQYFFLTLLAILVALCIALISWRKRRVNNGLTLFFLMLFAAEWGFANAMECFAHGIPAKVFWGQLSYIGSLSSPVLFLILVLQYTGRRAWETSGRWLYYFIVPVITLTLAFTNDRHGLIWTSFTPSPENEFILQYGHGIGFWIGTFGYSYLCMLAGTILILRTAISQSSTYRLQSISMLVASLLPWASNVMYVTNINPFQGLDITPITFSVTGIVTAFAIFRYHFLDLRPVARDVLVENMVDGLVVLDNDKRVIDINPSAKRFVSSNQKELIGLQVSQLLGEPFREIENLDNNTFHRLSLVWDAQQNMYLDLTIIPIREGRGRVIGQLVTIRDMTEQREIELELKKANEKLVGQLDKINLLQENLLEQANRDPLTGLYNRRSLDDILGLELERSRTEDTPVSLVMLDLDHFKNFNDTFGHSAGDEMLKKLGELLLTKTRHGDYVFRFGGEEFVIVMPGAPLEAAVKRAEEWRKQYEAVQILYNLAVLKNTFSAGVATFPQHASTGEELINAADQALYKAKNTGRNRVTTPGEPTLVDQNTTEVKGIPPEG